MRKRTIQVGRTKHKTVLFLCTGNYYRSRFAEVLFNSVAGKMALPWRASSRGLALERGVSNVGPMAASAIAALEALGVRAVDAAARFPVQVTIDDLEEAERIIALKHAPNTCPCCKSASWFGSIRSSSGMLTTPRRRWA